MTISKLFLLVVFALLFNSCDDEPPMPTGFQLKTSSVDEGSALNTKQVTVVANQNVASNLSITYTLREGQAKFGTDVVNSSGTLNFNGGKEATLPIEIIGDANLELLESFELILTFNSKEYSLPITITDDDPIETISSDADGFISTNVHNSMQLVWSDEFNGAQLNTADWSYEIGNGCNAGICGWGNNELQSYSSSSNNISITDGKLVITAREASGSYSSARIKTQAKKEFRYGRIDVRARLPKGQGIWPAIWMLGQNITTVGWPKCGEIDIMEMVGHMPHVVHGTVHYDNNGYKSSSGSKSIPTGDFSDQYHVFTMVWDFNTITWYVDNVPFKTFSNSLSGDYPFNGNFFFILNLAVGGNWPGSPDVSTIFPQKMEVDYIRLFQ